MSRDAGQGAQSLCSNHEGARQRIKRLKESDLAKARLKWREAQAASTRAQAEVLIREMDISLGSWGHKRAAIPVTDREVTALLASKS